MPSVFERIFAEVRRGFSPADLHQPIDNNDEKGIGLA
jgi:hypothetical protein